MQFPLFRATVIPTFSGPRLCAACREEVQQSFRPSLLIMPCRTCGELTGLGIGQRMTDCVHCGEFNLWPTDLPSGEDAAVCGPCLAAGRAAIPHESELGTVTWSDARRGLVEVGEESEKVARRAGFEIWTDEWGPPVTYARVPPEPLLELLRTPMHLATQREYWPFHCGRFCAFLGHWQQADFERQSGGHGRELFEACLDRDSGASWDWLRDDFATSYVYQCLGCQTFRVYVDTT
jgi:uncharacterized protein CbrC (UPF0167 family)